MLEIMEALALHLRETGYAVRLTAIPDPSMSPVMEITLPPLKNNFIIMPDAGTTVEVLHDKTAVMVEEIIDLADPNSVEHLLKLVENNFRL